MKIGIEIGIKTAHFSRFLAYLGCLYVELG